MVICVLAGILGGSVGLLSPVLPVFIAFSVPMVGITVAKLWQLDDPAYSAFGVISLLYLGVLIAQTRNSSRATRAAIELRFENLELVRDAETARLDAEHANMGIAPDQQAEVFKEFHQLGNPERDRRKGLGLAIAQGLCKTLGATLSVQSQRLSGSVFKLTLPLAPGMPAMPDVLTNLPLTLAAAPLNSTLLNGTHLLVIDDDEAVLSAMVQLAQNRGCSVDPASSIEQALAMAQRHTPDLLISDYRPRSQRTGAQAIAEVRGVLGTAVPALLITGDTAPGRLLQALGTGVPLLHKPLSPGELQRALTELLGNQRAAPPSVLS